MIRFFERPGYEPRSSAEWQRFLGKLMGFDLRNTLPMLNGNRLILRKSDSSNGHSRNNPRMHLASWTDCSKMGSLPIARKVLTAHCSNKLWCFENNSLRRCSINF